VATFIHHQLAALGDRDRGKRSVDALLRLSVLNLLHDIVAFEDFTEDDVAAIKPAVRIRTSLDTHSAEETLNGPCDNSSDEELGSVGVLSGVGHAYAISLMERAE
jgi:hypothetical protein